MYCKNCGAYNEDNASFCRGCGQPLQNRQPGPSGGGEPAPLTDPGGHPPVQKKPMDKKKLFIIIGSVAAALLAVILLAVLVNGGNPRTIAEEAVRDSINGRFERYWHRFPRVFREDVLTSMEMDDDEEYVDYLTERYAYYPDFIEDLEVRVKSIRFVNEKAVGRSERESMEDNYEFAIKEATDITLKVTWEVDGDEKTTRIAVRMIRVGGGWYLAPSNSIGNMIRNWTMGYEWQS